MVFPDVAASTKDTLAKKAMVRTGLGLEYCGFDANGLSLSLLLALLMIITCINIVNLVYQIRETQTTIVWQ
jgi:hypothetical protein